MFIKSIILEGFKTYKEETVLDNFASGHNIVLGKNGSGKSNLFDAVQFVLSDKFSHMRAEERQTLIHEGAGRDVMHASVEIIFDNADQRFPMEKRDTVSLKRTIGLKKDEYFWNHKHVAKQDVENLLESAGISRSNPYYIVEQGRVSKLIQMRDSERLELLKEIAGTRTYDTRRQESLKIMHETEARREQIEEVVTYIEERLAELGEEKTELSEFQTLDNDRRALEYTIYDKELKAADAKLAELEDGRLDAADDGKALHNKATAAKEARATAEEELAALASAVQQQQTQLAQIHESVLVADKKRTGIELTVSEQADVLSSHQHGRGKAEDELKALRGEISAVEKQLAAIDPEHQKCVSAEDNMKQRVETLKALIHGMYEKQGRSRQFKNAKERDAHLTLELTRITTSIASQRQQIATLAKQVDTVTKDQAEKQKTKVEAEKKLGEMKKEIEAATDEIQSVTEQRNEANDARKELWKQDADSDALFSRSREAMEKAQRALQYTMDKNVYRGLQAVKEGAEKLGLKGVYGPLIELFTTEKKFFKCVETTAGNSLFHVVVDNVETASKMIEYLQRVKAGRITFIPLAQLRDQHVEYPVSSDVFPMIKKLRFDPRYTKAIHQVFGKTLVTRSLAVATENARSHNLDAITLDGDQVNKKGALTGGFIDRKRSRIEAQQEVATHQSKFEQTTSDVTHVRQSLQQCDQGITRLLSEIQKLQNKRDHLRHAQQQQQHVAADVTKAVATLQDVVDKKTKEMESLENTIAVQEAKIEAVTAEMGGALSKQLTAEEASTLKQLQTEQDELNENLIKVSAQRTKVETQKSVLENSLNTNLRKRQDELRLQIESEETTMDAERLEEQKYVLSTLTDEVTELRRQIAATEAAVDGKRVRQATLQKTLNALKTKEDEANREVANQSKSIEKLLSQRSVYAKRKNDATNKIRELGALPADAYQQHQKKSVNALIEKLERVNKKLLKYGHVNKKAIDQYVSFQQQRADLLARKKEQDSGRAAIMDLIAHLDTQKDEAIQRTFKGIAKNFSQVFAKLVPGGKGSLVIYTKKQNKDGADDEDENADSSNRSAKKKQKTTPAKGKGKGKDKAPPMSSSLYTGVGISVSFAGTKQNMMQLSGGQQCVVALTLIFAIQRCDPSPFYFFDEIDAALDAVYRTSIANMIAEQSKDTQFITTTFRPEMVAVAGKFYGVSFQNKASKVTEITQQEAKQLILLVEREARQ